MMDWIRRSFRNRIFMTVLLVTLVPLLLCDVFMMQIVVGRSEKSLELQAQQEMERLSQSLDTALEEISCSIEELCDSTVVRSALRRDGEDSRLLYQLLYQKTSASRTYASFGIYDEEGRCRYNTDAGQTGGDLDAGWGLLRAAGQGQGLVYGPDEDGGMALAQAVRTGEGKTLGYVAARMNRDSISALLPQVLSSGNDFILLDSAWRMLFSSRGLQDREDVQALRAQLLRGESLRGNGGQYHYYARLHEASGFTLLLRQSKVYTPQVMDSLYAICGLMGILCLLLSLLTALVLSRYLAKPVKDLDQAMGQVEKGRLDIQLESDRKDEMGRLTASFNRMTREYRQNLERSVQRERELNETRLSMFQAQLNPHFLYNTLDSMKWMGVTNHVPQVAAMATDLASLLRAGVSGEKLITLEEELELLERYLDIQRLRFADSFACEVDIPEQFQHCLVPKLVLQPLVENAIIHGVADREDGYIKLYGRSEGGDLILSVQDNGRGIPEEILECLNSPGKEIPGGHLGLNNVGRIVRLYYGEGYGIRAARGQDGGSIIELRLPMQKKEGEHA